MKTIFSDHSVERNKTRKIPRKYIRDTIKQPDKTINSFKGRKLLQKAFDDKILEVVTITEENTITVVTQYYLEK